MTNERLARATQSLRPSVREYARDMGLAGAAYTIILSGSIVAIERFHVSQWAAAALSLATVAPVLFMLRDYLIFLSRVDEMQRRIQHESMLVAACIVGFACLTYGFLEAFADLPAIPGALLWVLPAMIAIWGVAQIFVRMRYR